MMENAASTSTPTTTSSQTPSDPHLQSDSPSFSWSTGPHRRIDPVSSSPQSDIPTPSTSTPHTTLPAHLPPTLLPDRPHSLSGISFRAYCLGLLSGASLALLPLLLLHFHSCLWRAPFFALLLSLFHYLEFHVTARYNPSVCTTSSFLLSANGSAYNIAHLSALVECLVRHSLPMSTKLVPTPLKNILLVAGLAMVLVGQTVRTTSMVQAGESFNHTVQTRRRETHRLVTHGLYGWLRHPSYFGFWWWGVGGQLVLGNWVCLAGYVVVLWRFFRGRIEKEEELLVGFFGKEYEEYRGRTRTGIPLIT